MWILDPLSIATHGYIGIGPTAGDFCPLPLAIATHGYVRFDVAPDDRPRRGGGGHGAVIQQPQRRPQEQIDDDTVELAVAAVIAIEQLYE